MPTMLYIAILSDGHMAVALRVSSTLLFSWGFSSNLGDSHIPFLPNLVACTLPCNNAHSIVF